MMTMFVMTLGELNYGELFTWDKLEYAALSNILFVMFVLGMPIIIMNMLVSHMTSLVQWYNTCGVWATKPSVGPNVNDVMH